MANGLLGKGATVADTPLEVYAVPASGVDFATINFRLCNTSGSIATVKIAIATSTSLAVADYIEFNAQLNPGGILQDSCLAMSPGEKFIVLSDQTGIAVRVHGLEKPAIIA